MSVAVPNRLRRAAVAAALELALTLGLSACSDGSGGGAAAPVYADRVVDYSPVTIGVTGGIFEQSNILGAPDGATQVTSLGYEPAASPSAVGGSITVGLGESTSRYCFGDGTGDDLIVYENVFALTDSNGSANFTEAAFVEVSEDNATFYRFAATYPTASAALVGVPESYSGMAGISVGGDGFDLGDVIATHGLPAGFRPCYVRIVDGGTIVPDYDSHGALSDPSTQNGSGADIDAVQALAIPVQGLSP